MRDKHEIKDEGIPQKVGESRATAVELQIAI